MIVQEERPRTYAHMTISWDDGSHCTIYFYFNLVLSRFVVLSIALSWRRVTHETENHVRRSTGWAVRNAAGSDYDSRRASGLRGLSLVDRWLCLFGYTFRRSPISDNSGVFDGNFVFCVLDIDNPEYFCTRDM